jgi:glycosyltransferase involved in cell wall biosynthesis
VCSETPSLHLVIAGEFWEEKAAYLARIRQLGLEEIVHIDDRYIPNEEVGLYFAATDLVVAPYRQQTGSAVAELAAGFGVPVLTSAMLPSQGEATGPSPVANSARPTLIAAAINRALTQGLPQPCRSESEEEATWLRLVRALEGTN